MLVPLTAACVALAASTFSIPEPALWTILKTEGGTVGACSLNANGTHDCGPAQINIETWVPHLSKTLRRPATEMLAAIRDNGCANVATAAYIVRTEMDRTNGNLAEAMGRYHSATPALKDRYIRKLIGSYQKLYGPPSR